MTTPQTTTMHEKLYELHKQYEGQEPDYYLDSKGIPTIGVGFAMGDRKNGKVVLTDYTKLKAELQKAGIELTEAQYASMQKAADIVNNGAIMTDKNGTPIKDADGNVMRTPPLSQKIYAVEGQINTLRQTMRTATGDEKTAYEAKLKELNTQRDDLQTSFESADLYKANTGMKKTPFTITSPQMKTLYDSKRDTKEAELISALGKQGVNYATLSPAMQTIALDLYYRGGKRLVGGDGTKLINEALKNNDPAAVMLQYQFGSNGDNAVNNDNRNAAGGNLAWELMSPEEQAKTQAGYKAYTANPANAATINRRNSRRDAPKNKMDVVYFHLDQDTAEKPGAFQQSTPTTTLPTTTLPTTTPTATINTPPNDTNTNDTNPPPTPTPPKNTHGLNTPHNLWDGSERRQSAMALMLWNMAQTKNVIPTLITTAMWGQTLPTQTLQQFLAPHRPLPTDAQRGIGLPTPENQNPTTQPTLTPTPWDGTERRSNWPLPPLNERLDNPDYLTMASWMFGGKDADQKTFDAMMYDTPKPTPTPTTPNPTQNGLALFGQAILRASANHFEKQQQTQNNTKPYPWMQWLPELWN